jgi:hypothetical protein
MRKLLPPAAALLALAAFGGGCGDSTSGPGADLVGTYVLISINGNPLPFAISTDEGLLEVTAGQFVFTGAGGCTGSITFRPVETQQTETLSNACTWTRTGSQVRIMWNDGATDTATLQNNRITLVAQDPGGLVLMLERQ